MVTRRTLRRPMAAATGLLVLLVATLAWFVDPQAAARVLAIGLVGAALARLLLPERDVLTARGRRFDVAVLLTLAAAAFLLAPWGLAVAPS